MGAVIEIEGLRKEYHRLRGGTTVAIDGLDLSVPEGGVYGFLGPNGSGKTTTIRCLVGLIRATDGHCKMLGADVPRHLPDILPKVGSIVEAPALFPTFSGKRNLRLLAGMAGFSHAAVDEAIARVGLSDRADDLVKTYSLGMRQRLGIAAALLKDPALLILDEPANGLDPAGIREIRDLVRSLGAEGRTVFVSSHILSEIQLVADQVAIIARGRCVAAGPVDEVLAKGGQPAGMVVRVDDTPTGVTVLRDAGFDVTLGHDDAIRVAADRTRAAEITRTLAGREVWVTELRHETASLEDAFLELTGQLGLGGQLEMGAGSAVGDVIPGALPPPPPPPPAPPSSPSAPSGSGSTEGSV